MAAPEDFVAPADAGELWEKFGAYMRHLVIKGHVPDQEADDVVSNIMARFIERDVLGMYDPETFVTYQGREIHVTFKAFLSSMVMRYVRGQRDKLGRRDKRELLIADRPQDETGTTWAELFGGQFFDDYSHLDAQQFITRMRAYLAMVPPGEATGLLELFDELVREVQAEGDVSVKEIKEHFGISTAAAKARLAALQATLRAVPEAAPPSWDVHGVTLGPLEVRAAIDALEGAKGIMVAQPLKDHPLTGCPKGWYHQFSREEIKLYPHIAIDPQTHRKPAGHVKAAVLHRLHRMLAEASFSSGPVPEPVLQAAPASAVPQPFSMMSSSEPDSAAEPDSPRDLLEFELFQLGADAQKVDYLLELAARLEPVPA